MDITILIPLYNGIEYLKGCLKSINNQTYDKYEVIIGINGHEKKSEVYKEALKYKTKKIHIIEYLTIGKSNTLNEMIKNAKYDIICLLDVDDLWCSTKLEEQIKIKNKYDVVGTFCKYFGEKIGSPNLPANEVKYNDFLKANPIINSSCMLNKKDCIWDPDIFLGLEDYNLWLKLNYEKKTFYNINKPLTLHRIHKKSFFNNDNHKNVKSLVQLWTNIYKN